MPIATILNLLFKIAVLTLFGFLLKKIGLIPKDVQKGLNTLLVKAILPVSILMSSNNTYTSDSAQNMLLTAAVAAGYYLVSLILTTLLSSGLRRLSQPGKNVFVTMIVFANVGFIGFPIIGELYGNEGTLYTVVYNIFYQLIFFTYGVSLLSGKKQMKLKQLYTNPVTIASALSVILFLTQFKFPEGIASGLTSIGNMTAPVSLMLIGCSLAEVKLKEILTDRYSYYVSFHRMLFLPVVTLGVLWVLELPPVVAGTCAILTALPAGSLNAIYAEQYDCESGFASRTVIQTMVCMIATLPLTILAVNSLF